MAASAIFDPPVGNIVVPVNTRSGLKAAADLLRERLTPGHRPNTRPTAERIAAEVRRRDHSLTIDMGKSSANMRLKY